jgi:hypothetical protein
MANDAHAIRLRSAIKADDTLDPQLYRVTTTAAFVSVIQAGAV